jgi:hypothetical protein
MIGVADVAGAVETFRNLGFTVTHGESPEDAGRQAAYGVFGDFYIEFRATEDSQRLDEPTASGLESQKARSINRIVLRTDNLDAEVARLRSGGIPVSNPAGEGISRSDPWPGTVAVVDGLVPLGLVEHDQASARFALVGGGVTHPNTTTALERMYIAVESIERELPAFEQLLGMPAPEPEMGTVIMSMMSVFYLGDIGIAVAEPRGPGPTADALSSNGPGLFQILFRADHLDRAAALMVEAGVPAPARGTRLSGESALLVEPEHACNLYVALAGQP